MPVREIDIAEHFDAALPLMEANWRETGCGFDFKPSRELFVQGQAMGMVYAMGAFIGDELVGYASAIVAPHPFNPEVTCASNNVLYVVPQYRSGVLPGRLMLGMERAAQARGARFVFWHTRAGTPVAEMMAEHGYENGDLVMMKELH